MRAPHEAQASLFELRSFRFMSVLTRSNLPDGAALEKLPGRGSRNWEVLRRPTLLHNGRIVLVPLHSLVTT
jgi:hypothetical protein